MSNYFQSFGWSKIIYANLDEDVRENIAFIDTADFNNSEKEEDNFPAESKNRNQKNKASGEKKKWSIKNFLKPKSSSEASSNFQPVPSTSTTSVPNFFQQEQNVEFQDILDSDVPN